MRLESTQGDAKERKTGPLVPFGAARGRVGLMRGIRCGAACRDGRRVGSTRMRVATLGRGARCRTLAAILLAALPLAVLLVLPSRAGAAADPMAGLADPETTSYRLLGRGFLTSASHPMHPGDFYRYDAAIRISVHPWPGEAAIEIVRFAEGQEFLDRYFVRRGRIFQADTTGRVQEAKRLGDVSAPALAALHPVLVANALREDRENLRAGGKNSYAFAWNDKLWTVQRDARSGGIAKLERRVDHDLFGDGSEVVSFEGWTSAAGYATPGGRVSVMLRGRETARFDFTSVDRDSLVAVPARDREGDRWRILSPDEITIREVAPHLFNVDLDSVNTRVTIAEFADHLVVLEGAFSSFNCDLIAEKVRARFHKPVRYFAFSHLHGQYVGGTRTWVHEGATVIVPPTTAPLIETVVHASRDLRPDAFSRDPKPLHIETVKEHRRLEDGTNVLDIYNIEQDHTDEYFVFHFPKQKILLTGDLLFVRSGKPLPKRSQYVCKAVAKYGLDVEMYYATWPLNGYGTRNIVTGEEMRAACAAADTTQAR